MSVKILPRDSLLERKARGAFFTPPAIARFLTDWAIADDPNARVLDPTCGDGVFLLAAGEQLRALGASSAAAKKQLSGVDVHGPSLKHARSLLREGSLDATLVESDFFDVFTPSQLGGHKLAWQDAVVGNPPFVRYQEFGVEVRKRSAAAALAQGVRLSGLASSWAPLLVHASGFLKPDGRLAMVVPSELLTVSYAEPIRRWLRKRFRAVSLVMFDDLQFDAEEQVVLLVARGTGGCDAFTLYYVKDSNDLERLHIFDASSAALGEGGKWTDLMLPHETRQLFKRVLSERFVRLDAYGTPELGTVTGSNEFFAISEATRIKHGLSESLLRRISPPGTKHLKGLAFSRAQWEELKVSGERVWLLCPDPKTRSKALAGYVKHGEALGVHEAYKCTVRTPWWRPPVVSEPDLFFTYMSHRYPRLIANTAEVTLVNSMHGVRLNEGVPAETRDALPLLAFNSVTMLGGEVQGRSYGGGILKMEPREAAGLPMPPPEALTQAWAKLSERRAAFDSALKRGEWSSVVDEVDRVLLRQTMRLSQAEVLAIREAATQLRVRRTRQTEPDAATA